MLNNKKLKIDNVWGDADFDLTDELKKVFKI
jgi:hypothetical protein